MPRKMAWSLCKLCKRPYRARESDIKRGRKFCSRSCASIAKPRPDQKGENNGNWKGGITQHMKGYIYQYAPDHPAQSNGYVFQHRLVAEDKLGRHLRNDEVVHHIDGDVTNNHPANIEVHTMSQHAKLHAKLRREKAIKTG